MNNIKKYTSGITLVNEDGEHLHIREDLDNEVLEIAIGNGTFWFEEPDIEVIVEALEEIKKRSEER